MARKANRSSRCVAGVVVALGLMSLGAPRAIQAQRATTVRVIDDQARPVPYAVVRIGKGSARIADDSGRIVTTVADDDSIRVNARRIGYRELDGWVRGPKATGEVLITLAALARVLDPTVVTEVASTPLSRTGFYDRVQRVQRGAILGEFVTPEELDRRGASNTSELLMGRQYARVSQLASANAGGRRPLVVLGRGRCGMTIIVDGQRLNNTLESTIMPDVPTSLTHRNQSGVGGANTAISIDEAVAGRTIMAIEIYPSTANAPAELIPLTGGGSCGIVAIWTGPRN